MEEERKEREIALANDTALARMDQDHPELYRPVVWKPPWELEHGSRHRETYDEGEWIEDPKKFCRWWNKFVVPSQVTCRDPLSDDEEKADRAELAALIKERDRAHLKQELHKLRSLKAKGFQEDPEVPGAKRQRLDMDAVALQRQVSGGTGYFHQSM